MRVAQISFFVDPRGRGAQQLLEDWSSLRDVADCAQRAGAAVSVIQAANQAEQLTRNGVDYHFMPVIGGRARRLQPDFAQLLQRLAPDVLHVHGLGFAREVQALAAAAPGVPILLQDHASGVPRPWRRGLWRRGFAVAAGVAFCARDQAAPFIAAGLLARDARVFAVPESTCRFTPGDREQARRECGVDGDPLLLWVGHLDANKDPLTVLEGVSAAARERPGLRLVACFGSAPLMRQVRRRLEADAALRGRVRLLGAVPHARIETLMRAADLFVLGSHREGSGYSLIEAMACGLPPVVTDIPSFRELTGGGRVGALWPVGDAQALSQRLMAVAARQPAALRPAVREHFETELSFAAVGRKLVAAYQALT